jgi:hypothetical protein
MSATAAAAAGLVGGLGLAWLSGGCASTAAPSPAALPLDGIKLYYWPATGLAEVIRLALSEAGVSHEDCVFEKLPHLAVYGSKGWFPEYAQTAAYAKFCADCRAKGGNPTTK